MFFVWAGVILNAQNSGYEKIVPTYQLSDVPLDIPDTRLNISQAQEDNEGYLWLATDNGLWQFDGSTSQRFANGSEKFPVLKRDVSSNFYGLIKDQNGNFITSVVEENLLIKYNPDNRKIVDTITVLMDIPIGQLLFEVDRFNALYYTSINRSSLRYTLHKMGEDKVEHPIFEIPKVNGINDKIVELNIVQNRVFLLTETMLYTLSLDGKLIDKVDITKGWAYWPSTYSDAKDYYILNETTATLMKWDFKTDTLFPYFKFPEAFPGIFSIFQVHDGIIICYNDNELTVYNSKNKTYQIIKNNDKSSSENGDQLFLIEEGLLLKPDGTILFFESNKAHRLGPKPKNEAFFKETIHGHSKDLSFRGLTEDSEKNIYVTYYTAEIAKKSKGSQDFTVCKIPKDPRIKMESTYSISAYKEKLLWNNTLLDLKNNHIEPMSQNREFGHTTQFLKGDSLWLYPWWGNSLEVYNLSDKTGEVYTLDVSDRPEVRFSLINTFVEDAKGKNLYAASRYNGISALTKKGKVLKNYDTGFLKTDKEKGINHLYLDAPILWYAGSNGLGALNTEKGTVKIFEFPDSMDNNNLVNRDVYSIVPLSDDEFYLGTDNGLIRFNKKTYNYFELVKGHPLANVEFNRESFLKASDGKYYMGTTTSLYSFFPEDLEWDLKNEKDKNIRINLVSILNDVGEYRYISEEMNQKNTLMLGPNDVNIEIDYAALQEEKEVLYSHRIKGINTIWSDYSKERKLNLVGLAPGTYNLEIRTANSPQNIKTLTIQKAQYWYLRWYSQLVFILLFVLLIALLISYRYRLRLQKERELAGLRNKISSDLHDDVGSILTAVAMQSEILGKNAKADESEKLKRIGSLSREAMGRMRDTVWSIDSKKDSMGSLLSRMKDFATDVFQDNEQLSYHFINEKETKAEQPLNPFIRQNVYLIFKEAITNCIKHCNGDRVEIALKYSKTELFMEIADNGCQNSDIQTSGLGLTNMDLRAKRMNGNLKIETENGFKITLQVPLH